MVQLVTFELHVPTKRDRKKNLQVHYIIKGNIISESFSILQKVFQITILKLQLLSLKREEVQDSVYNIFWRIEPE